MHTVDIIVPCFNEEAVIEQYLRETNQTISAIEGYRFRYILVDDGSKDNTLKTIEAAAQKQDNIAFLSFSRNFGKEAAIYAGLSHADADYVILMDADLQHPPLLIPRMIEGVEEGHDCCAAFRTDQKGERGLRRVFSRAFYSLYNRMTGLNLPYGAVDYRIMSRQMVQAVLSICEVQRFSKGIFNWVGYDTQWIPYENVERAAGETKWSFWSLVRYASDGITAFTSFPLRVISIIGFLISFFAFIYILVTLIQTMIFGIDVPGYVTTLSATLFLGGVIELSIGILGEYIGRIYMESKKRPIYLLKRSSLQKPEADEPGENR